MSLVIPIALLGLLASVSPSTIVVFIVLLTTTRARTNAAAFLIGWGFSLIIVFAVSYAADGTRAAQQVGGRTTVKIIDILLGAALVIAAVRQWRHRDRPRTGSRLTRKFTARLEHLRPWQAVTIGIIEQPWTLTAAAAVLLVRHHAASLVVIVAFVVFTVLSTASVGLIFVYFTRRPGEAEAHLSDLRNRLVRAGPAIFATVSLAVGAFLIIDGAVGIMRR
jgi:Sap, sulfolipid-1-addressing protein